MQQEYTDFLGVADHLIDNHNTVSARSQGKEKSFQTHLAY